MYCLTCHTQLGASAMKQNHAMSFEDCVVLFNAVNTQNFALATETVGV